jgi:hypothetical protein
MPNALAGKILFVVIEVWIWMRQYNEKKGQIFFISGVRVVMWKWQPQG